VKLKTVKIILTISVSIIFCLFVFLAPTSKKMANYEKTFSDVERLSIFIEEFESTQGKYPDSVSNLVSYVEADERDVIKEIIQTNWKNQYQYWPLTNSFQINAKGYHFVCDHFVGGLEIRGDFTTNSMTATTKVNPIRQP